MLNEEFTRRPEQWGHKNIVHTVVASYHDRPGYVNAMAALVAREIAAYTAEQRMEGVQVRVRLGLELEMVTSRCIGFVIDVGIGSVLVLDVLVDGVGNGVEGGSGIMVGHGIGIVVVVAVRIGTGIGSGIEVGSGTVVGSWSGVAVALVDVAAVAIGLGLGLWL